MDGPALPAAPRGKPLFTNAYLLVANQLSSAALGFLYWVLAARLYPVEVVGASSAVISTLLLIAALSQLGLKSGMTRFIPRAGGRVRVIVLSAYAVTAAAAALLTLAAFAAANAVGLRSTPAFGTYSPALVVLATVFWAIFYLQDGVLIGLKRPAWVLAENLGFNVAKIVLLVLGVRLLADAGIVGSWFLPAPLAVLAVSVLAFARLRGAARPIAGQDAPVTLREVVASVTADHAGSIAAEASVRLLPLLVVASLGRAANAYFYQAWLIANTLTLVASGMTSSFAAEAAGDRGRTAEHGREILRHMALLIVPAAAVLAIAAPQVLALFGVQYARAGAPVLRWLAVAAIPVTFNTWYISFSLVRGRPRRALGVQVLGAALLAGLAYPALRAFGVTGVALAWLAAQTAVAAVAALDALPLLSVAAAAASSGGLRRADWRFLHDTPALGRTAVLAGGALAESARALAAEAVVGPSAGEGRCDVSVVGEAGPEALRSAFDALRPGGSCYAEARGRLPWETARLAARLERAGFEDVRVWWPLPTPGRAALWVAARPLAPGYAEAIAETVGAALGRGLRGRLASAVAGLAVRTGVTVSAPCAVAGKPGGEPALRLPDLLAERIAESAGVPSADVLLVMRTGGERDENKVNWLAFERGRRRPSWIAKASRQGDSGVALRREHTMLRLLESRAGLAGRVVVPRVLLFTEAAGSPVLVQGMLSGGSGLDAGRSGGFDTLATLLAEALTALAGGEVAPRLSWWDRLAEPWLAELAALVDGLAEPGLVPAVRKSLSGLGTLPLVVTHGDCSPWNLVVADDRVGLFDWEHGSEQGLPLTDLVYCLAMTALWLEGKPDPREAGAAYERLLDPLDERGAVFCRAVDGYASRLGLRPEDVPRLRLATWLAHATNDVRNLLASDPAPSSATLARSVCLPLLEVELAQACTEEDGGADDVAR